MFNFYVRMFAYVLSKLGQLLDLFELLLLLALHLAALALNFPGCALKHAFVLTHLFYIGGE